jgi:DNA mismatch repair protein MutL
MGNIKVLSEEVANRIAAGEVVERPFSVIKELVENSIDANASKITVIIENGGKKLMQVADNGVGMSEDDAMQCFERHATSKIRTVTDIFNISSLGFRGEALLAAKVEFDSGQLKDFSKSSANEGTTVTVRKLFGNVPARKKFLKSDQVEFKHILNYLHYQSILYPDIHFRFIADAKEKLNYPAVKNKELRMQAIFGSDFLKRDLIKIDTGNQEMKGNETVRLYLRFGRRSCWFCRLPLSFREWKIHQRQDSFA